MVPSHTPPAASGKREDTNDGISDYEANEAVPLLKGLSHLKTEAKSH